METCLFYLYCLSSTGHQTKLHPPPPSSSKQSTKNSKPALRHPVLNKLHAHLSLNMPNNKRHKPKPIRYQIRDEIMAPAPSSAIGSYAYFNHKPFQQQHQIDFSNHFGFSNTNNQQKHSNQNDLQQNFIYFNHNDEFTRNLVPPPPIYSPQGEKETVSPKINKHLPENLIVQLPPPYNRFQQQQQPNFDLEITKENLKEFHSTLAPVNYKTSTESFLQTNQQHTVGKNYPTYEVTEDKDYSEHFSSFKPVFSMQHKQNGFQYNQFGFTQQNEPQFLPTPLNSDLFPTSPTQAEVSTIYSEISQINKKKTAQNGQTTLNYNIKEVATHFPIFEQNDEVKPTTQTVYATRTVQGQQRKPNHRRRRPTRPTSTTTTSATTEAEIITDNLYRNTFDQSENVQTVPVTIKPHRRRRPTNPTKYRPTEPPEEPLTYRTEPITRSKPIETVTEEVFVKNHRIRPTLKYSNHQTELEVDEIELEDDNNKDELITNQKQVETVTEQVFMKNHQNRPTLKYSNHYSDNEDEYNKNINNFNEFKAQEAEIPVEETFRVKTKRRRLRPISTTSTTTEAIISTNLNIPENELDYTTDPASEDQINQSDLKNQAEESITIKEVYDFENEKDYFTSLTTSSTTSSTTTAETPTATTKANRLRRPIKYEVQRPRFSVKDYRQRLNQYTSTTTETVRNTSESPRIRYPNRFKIMPAVENEEITEPIRTKFTPKDPRRKTSNESTNSASTTEKNRSTNRLKTFGRYRSTTEPTTTSTTQKISIKPNIFNNLKRPQPLSLRNRIYLKRNITTTSEPTVEETKESNTEKTEVTIPFETAESKIELTTETFEQTTTESNKNSNNSDLSDEDETFLQLQRISELTSSAHKQYNTPGMFKSVSPTSRRVPNYFTIATEDPILPIEAFFPNLGQKNNEKN